jgi:hypothetical protein
MASVSPIGRHRREWTAPDGWSVRVVSLQAPGDKRAHQYYQVRHFECLVKETRFVGTVLFVMGEAAYSELTEVSPS